MNAARYYRRRNKIAPEALNRRIMAELTLGLVGKGILPGETLTGIVQRECPQVFTKAAEEGFSVTFDLPENTHVNLRRGKMFFLFERAA